MSAHDKASGKSQKITITSDKGRLSEDEIARMIKEAEENAESDKIVREGIEARNQLESYLYSLRTTIDDTLKDKIDAADKDLISKAITDGNTWLENNTSGTKEIYLEKRKEIEAVAVPIMTKAYGGSGPGGGAAEGGGASPDQDQQSGSSPSDGGGSEDPSGPTVEEVD